MIEAWFIKVFGEQTWGLGMAISVLILWYLLWAIFGCHREHVDNDWDDD